MDCRLKIDVLSYWFLVPCPSSLAFWRFAFGSREEALVCHCRFSRSDYRLKGCRMLRPNSVAGRPKPCRVSRSVQQRTTNNGQRTKRRTNPNKPKPVKLMGMSKMDLGAKKQTQWGYLDWFQYDGDKKRSFFEENGSKRAIPRFLTWLGPDTGGPKSEGNRNKPKQTQTG